MAVQWLKITPLTVGGISQPVLTVSGTGS